MKKRQRYSKELKQEAVAMVISRGVSALSKWGSDHRNRLRDPKAVSEAEYEELKRLRKENRILKLERDLLKKTAVYFVKESK